MDVNVGFHKTGTIMPPLDHINTAGVNHLLPWIPKWLDLNIMIPLIATAIVVAVGILVICVAITRRRSDDPRGGPKDVYCRFHSSSHQKFNWFTIKNRNMNFERKKSSNSRFNFLKSDQQY